MSALANWSNLIRPSVTASIYLLIGIFLTRPCKALSKFLTLGLSLLTKMLWLRKQVLGDTPMASSKGVGGLWVKKVNGAKTTQKP